jgi:hypothetical protein
MHYHIQAEDAKFLAMKMRGIVEYLVEDLQCQKTHLWNSSRNSLTILIKYQNIMDWEHERLKWFNFSKNHILNKLKFYWVIKGIILINGCLVFNVSLCKSLSMVNF